MLSESELNELKGDQIALQNELNNQKKALASKLKKDRLKITTQKGKYKYRRRLIFIRWFEVFFRNFKMWKHRFLMGIFWKNQKPF